jgi:hypothetical protein
MRVTDAQGNKVQFKNAFLTVLDPRNRPGASEEDIAKIPSSLVSELFYVENNE